MRLVLGERPTLVFALATRICTTSISIDAVILKVLRYVKEFTNGGTPSRAGWNSQVSDKGGPVVKRLVAIALVMVAALTVFAACGGETEPPPVVSQRASPPPPPPAPAAEARGVTPTLPVGGTPVTVDLADKGGIGPFSFSPIDFTFSRGEVVNFSFVSEAVLHTFTVEGLEIDVQVDGGETVDFTFTFDKPGTYKLVCIPHQELGMVGTITVSDTPASQAPVPTAPAAAPAEAPGTDVSVQFTDAKGLGPFEFDPSEFSFDAGEAVSFTFTSESQLHTFTVDDLGIDVTVDGGETVEFSFTFDKPGTYELVCIPHLALGMVGTITVR
jgi:plastocyanin